MSNVPTPAQIYARSWREIDVDILPEDLLEWEELFVWNTEAPDKARRTLACRYMRLMQPIVVVQGSSGDILQAFVVETC